MLTQDEHDTVLTDGELAWDAVGRLTYVGPARGPAGPGDHRAHDAIVVPGLVNAHSHAARSVLRGLDDEGDDADRSARVRSVEARLTHEELRDGLALALVEMLRSGTTTFADLYHWDADLLGLVVESGMRVLAAPLSLGYDVVSFPAASPGDGLEALRLTEELAADFAGDPQVRLAFGPHSAYACPDNHLSDVARRAQRLGLPVHVHLSETAAEVADSVERCGLTPVAHAERLGLLDGPALVAHAVHLAPADVGILAVRGAAVAHNPVSNLRLGAGVAPVTDLVAAGVPVGLGTDSVVSCGTLDLFDQVRVASIVHRGAIRPRDHRSCGDVLRMATVDGALAVGFPEVGSLVPGKWADVTVVDAATTAGTPLASPDSYLAFVAHGDQVRDVFVGGRRVVADRVVTPLDEAAARDRVRTCARRVLAD